MKGQFAKIFNTIKLGSFPCLQNNLLFVCCAVCLPPAEGQDKTAGKQSRSSRLGLVCQGAEKWNILPTPLQSFTNRKQKGLDFFLHRIDAYRLAWLFYITNTITTTIFTTITNRATSANNSTIISNNNHWHQQKQTLDTRTLLHLESKLKNIQQKCILYLVFLFFYTLMFKKKSFKRTDATESHSI